MIFLARGIGIILPVIFLCPFFLSRRRPMPSSIDKFLVVSVVNLMSVNIKCFEINPVRRLLVF